MELPINTFKRALREQRHQTGLWVTLAHPNSTELVAASGFDWLLLDTEHTPALLPTVMGQLQAAAAYGSHPVVRPSWNDKVQIKQYLDIGAQTLLLPYVQNAAEAESAVAGMRYAPRGVRGVSGTMRATRYGRVPDYMRRCEEELCLLVQAETGEALENLDAIIAVDGVDGVFIGPADLAASLGYPGEPQHPNVVAAVEQAIRRVRAAGKAPGVLTTDETLARRYMAAGSLYTAVGVDAAILARHCDQLAARFAATAHE
ncbi:aldolase/citrate lyase family protein [Achromobacter mucicolens]|uniref:Aldolase/citrate lyase family protein n=1 Tax=Achromobacter mucicolens TaxID=1389922 RepID=A0ABD4YPY4_9BURK|nr:aldolase/citrate lyase family protein [Achromobacter mucicolens]MDH1176686.1 aldolase/citrate lyase family protein [Achromobacter mucicolens]